jgi:hypothetical protein
LQSCTQSAFSGLAKPLFISPVNPLKTQMTEIAIVPFLAFDVRDNMPLILGFKPTPFVL